MKPDIVHLLSGGLDSTTLLYEQRHNGDSVLCVLCHYGQTHYKELDFARATCRKLEVPWEDVELSHVFGKSSLIQECKGSIVVPNRNAVMLNIAVAIAVNVGAELVTYACNLDDRKMFPDCRPEFFSKLNEAIEAGGVDMEIWAPYSVFTKRHIVERARRLGVPLNETWSCYKGGRKPCGQCLACKMRRKAGA